MNNKKSLGQFFTTNYEYILQNMSIPKNVKNIIEPFAGNGDLLQFINKNDYIIECYDIDPKHDYIIKQDTLLNPPDYKNKYILTNPPYLARNKSIDKKIFDLYNTNDLYKCFIENLINSGCLGGIIIIPLNFICSIRKNDIEIREKFVKKYDIEILNIFEEKVFEDTSYSVCSLQFVKKSNNIDNIIKCYIYPQNKHIDLVLNSINNYTIGGEIYKLQQNKKYIIERATKIFTNHNNFTNILVKCIDDNINNKICLSIVDDKIKNKYIDNTPNLSARSYAILVIEPKITLNEQKELVNKFNKYINECRDKYNSLFLTNYRESNTIARKRISFNLIYNICNYLLSQ